MSRWNVITAGPSAGKSSVIRELSSRGYRTAPEAARILFDQAISEGRDPAAVREDDDFHEQVERIDRRIESNLPEDEIVYLDRSLADNIAYRRHFSENPPDRLVSDALWTLARECENRYHNVFLLERISFEDDEARVEDEREAQQIHEEIRRAYQDIGYDVIDVQVAPVDQRADIIEKTL